MIYKIAGVSFSSDYNFKQGELLSFSDFIVMSSQDISFVLKVVTRNNDVAGMGHYVLWEKLPHALTIYESVLLADDSWKKAYLLSPVKEEAVSTFLSHLFYTHAVRRQMVQLHCATIDDGGRGVLFLGPSGIGKTTQAERWAEFRGASIINGDVGFVQRTEREYIAWGTPWHGSSPYCLNASVPVKALVVLKQAPENRLRELTGFEKVSEIAGSVFYPTWLEDGMELCTDTLNHLLTDLPVYRLDNRADRESVEILAKELDRIT